MVAFPKGGNCGFLPAVNDILEELGLNVEFKRQATLVQIAEGIKQYGIENFSVVDGGMNFKE